MNTTFNRAIKEALKKKSWSIRKLARELNLEPGILSRILRGERNPPSNERIIVKLAQKLNIDPDTLVIYTGRIPLKYQKDLEKPGAIKLLTRARTLPEAEKPAPRVKKIKKAVKEEMPDELL